VRTGFRYPGSNLDTVQLSIFGHQSRADFLWGLSVRPCLKLPLRKGLRVIYGSTWERTVGLPRGGVCLGSERAGFCAGVIHHDRFFWSGPWFVYTTGF
jgi:hypothetical protein